MKEPVDRDRAHALMMAALDGEISAAERRELDDLLARAPDVRADWERLVRLKEVTATMTLRQPPEEVWDRYWTSVYNRTERRLGWLLFWPGAIVLAAWGLWHALGAVLGDTTLPIVIRGAIVAVALGLLVLALSVAREKLFTHRRDPYQKEVTR